MLELDKFNLIDVEEENLEILLKWRNSDHIRASMYSDHIISTAEHQRWFKKVKNDESTIAKLFVYEEKPIGFVNFTKIDRKNNTCYWGFYIGEKHRPPHSGTVMGLLALEFIFEKYGIRKVCAEVLDFNTTSINYHKKLGFQEEGRLVKHILKNNCYIDIIAMALFSEHWLDHKEKLQQEVQQKYE